MQLFANILDLLFPPSPEARLVRAIGESNTILNFYTPQNFETTTALMSFRSPAVRALIHEAKFHNNPTAFQLLGTILHHHLTTHHPVNPVLLVPIPLSSKRERERGYNQVTEVVKQANVDPTHFTFRTDIVVRHVHTQPQTDLSKAERLTNLTNAFSIKKPEAVTGNTIMVLDDVVTTGATLTAVKTALLPYSPASVTCLAWAH